MIDQIIQFIEICCGFILFGCIYYNFRLEIDDILLRTKGNQIILENIERKLNKLIDNSKNPDKIKTEIDNDLNDI